MADNLTEGILEPRGFIDRALREDLIASQEILSPELFAHKVSVLKGSIRHHGQKRRQALGEAEQARKDGAERTQELVRLLEAQNKVLRAEVEQLKAKEPDWNQAADRIERAEQRVAELEAQVAETDRVADYAAGLRIAPWIPDEEEFQPVHDALQVDDQGRAYIDKSGEELPLTVSEVEADKAVEDLGTEVSPEQFQTLRERLKAYAPLVVHDGPPEPQEVAESNTAIYKLSPDSPDQPETALPEPVPGEDKGMYYLINLGDGEVLKCPGNSNIAIIHLKAIREWQYEQQDREPLDRYASLIGCYGPYPLSVGGEDDPTGFRAYGFTATLEGHVEQTPDEWKRVANVDGSTLAN